MIVAVWGGSPLYHPVAMQDPDGLLRNLDSDFGVLEFNGTQQYFALDGQHRLKAIKDALKQNPDLAKEDICVLIVSHGDTAEGQRRTRRLFTNINKHAKKTTKAEEIALDEDDAIAIITRRLVMEHPFLHATGRVKVIGGQADGGRLKLATGNVSKSDPNALFTIGGLYEITKSLVAGFKLPAFGGPQGLRPSDEVLESTFDIVSAKIHELLECCGNVKDRLSAVSSARDLRAPKDDEGAGHPFMRALVQRVIVKVIEFLLGQLVPWPEIQRSLRALPWQLEQNPWNAVASVDGNKVKMRTNREFAELLQKLLIAHIAPRTKSDRHGRNIDA